MRITSLFVVEAYSRKSLRDFSCAFIRAVFGEKLFSLRSLSSSFSGLIESSGSTGKRGLWKKV